jgi:hypothetical protein
MYEIDALQSQAESLADAMGDQHQMIDFSPLIFAVNFPRIFHLLLLLHTGLLLEFCGILGFTRKRGHLPL